MDCLKIFTVSLGCPKNQVDTEYALGTFRSVFSRIELVANPSDANILLVNTCSFIERTVTESIDHILSLAAEKKPGQRLVVMGCLYQRYGNALYAELPEVDAFFGNTIPEDFAVSLNYGPQTCTGRVSRYPATPPWRAYVKISEGCSNRCTYCLIPSIRGPHLSLNPDTILGQVLELEKQGVKEVTIVAQDVTAWTWNDMDISDLLALIASRTSIPWIRLLYLNPLRLNAKLLETVAANPSICPYLDIPVQHASDPVLKRMGRGYDSDVLERLFEMVRSILPDSAVRTTVMVGFPGETEADFENLVDFVSRWRFDHLGCFAYSDEEEAASHRLHEKVPPAVAERRLRHIMDIQRDISRENLKRFAGSTQEVLIEGKSRDTDLLLAGRTKFQAPEIDGLVYINEGYCPEPGRLVNVRISESHDYDLVGSILP